MVKESDYNAPVYPTWCPGCGDFGIWRALKKALVKLGLAPHEVLIVYGIGCSGNMCSFVNAYGFHGLHGRAIPVGIGARLANVNIPVIVCGGDGDLLAEGGNHFLNAARGNHNITVIIHNNEVYGLTKNQASPTTHQDYPGSSTPFGQIEMPVNPSAVALAAGATFVAREFAGNIEALSDLYVKAITHQGYSVVDTLQPCVTWRQKDHPFEWYRERIAPLDAKAWPTKDRGKAISKVLEEMSNNYKSMPTGIFYTEKRPTYEERLMKTTGVKLPLKLDITKRQVATSCKRFM